MSTKGLKNLSVGEWVGFSLGLILLAFIPVIGWLASLGIQLYWAFGQRFENHVLRNFGRASLILQAIGFVIALFFFGSIITAIGLASTI